MFGDYWSLLYMAAQYAALGQEPPLGPIISHSGSQVLGGPWSIKLTCPWMAMVGSGSKPRAVNVTHLDGLDQTHRLEESSFHQQPPTPPQKKHVPYVHEWRETSAGGDTWRWMDPVAAIILSALCLYFRPLAETLQDGWAGSVSRGS